MRIKAGRGGNDEGFLSCVQLNIYPASQNRYGKLPYSFTGRLPKTLIVFPGYQRDLFVISTKQIYYIFAREECEEQGAA
jgi:hypothetical protein